ncbi:hypothetical protein BB561_002266 [Smittium simulii]|uniref:Rab3 GTPase-activating protein catalytic subunit n=1 Tax=Smittium simulii TaxID=133385 RepID=A0A2T9YR04_9FUNG|nr:hypothetical protein BB561_002266 [Smittium simulii]
MDDEQYEIVDYTTASSWESLVSIIENILIKWNLENGADPVFNTVYDLPTIHSIVDSDSISLSDKIEATLNWSIMIQEIEYSGKKLALMIHRHPSFYPTSKQASFSKKKLSFEQLFPQVFIVDKHSQNTCLKEIDGVIDTELMCLHPLHRWAGLDLFITFWCYGNTSTKNSHSKPSVLLSHKRISQLLNLDSFEITTETAKLLQSALNVACINVGCVLPSFVPLDAGWNYLYGGRHNQTVSLLLNHKIDSHNFHQNTTQSQNLNIINQPCKSLNAIASIERVFESLKSLQITPDLHNIYGLYNAFITRFNIPNYLNCSKNNSFSSDSLHKLCKTTIAGSYSYKIYNTYDKLWNSNVEGFYNQINGLDVGPVNDPLRQLGLITFFAPVDISEYINDKPSSSNQLYLKNANEYKLAAKFLDFSKDRTMLSEAVGGISEAYLQNKHRVFDIICDFRTPGIISLHFDTFLTSLNEILTNKCNKNVLYNHHPLDTTLNPDGSDLGLSLSIKSFINKTKHGTCIKYNSVMWRFCKNIISIYTLNTANHWKSPNWVIFTSVLWAIILKDFRYKWENLILIPDNDIFESQDLDQTASFIDLRYNIIQQKIDMINNCILRKKLLATCENHKQSITASSLTLDIDSTDKNLTNRLHSFLTCEIELFRKQLSETEKNDFDPNISDISQEKNYNQKESVDDFITLSSTVFDQNHGKTVPCDKNLLLKERVNFSSSPTTEFNISQHVSSIISQNLEDMSMPLATPQNINTKSEKLKYNSTRKTILNHAPKSSNDIQMVQNIKTNNSSYHSNFSDLPIGTSSNSVEFYNIADSPSTVLIQNVKTTNTHPDTNIITNVKTRFSDCSNVDFSDVFVDSNSDFLIPQSEDSYTNQLVNKNKLISRSTKPTNVNDFKPQSAIFDCNDISSYGIKPKLSGSSGNYFNEKSAPYVEVGLSSSFNSTTSDYLIVAKNTSNNSSKNKVDLNDQMQIKSLSSFDSFIDNVQTTNIDKNIKDAEHDDFLDQNNIDCNMEQNQLVEKAFKKSLELLPHEYDGRLSILPNVYIMNSDPLEPVWVPVTQQPPLFTEDMLIENESKYVKLDDKDEISDFKSELFYQDLLSDMEAFKAANPQANLVDFIRWYSPKDWIPAKCKNVQNNEDACKDSIACKSQNLKYQTESMKPNNNSIKILDSDKVDLTNSSEVYNLANLQENNDITGKIENKTLSDETNLSVNDKNAQNASKAAVTQTYSCEFSGKLSTRMSKKGNLWQQLWEQARRVPVYNQVSRFDCDSEGTKALEYLESINLCDLFELIFPSITVLALECLIKQPISTKLDGLKNSIDSLSKEILQCSNSLNESNNISNKVGDQCESASFIENSTIYLDSETESETETNIIKKITKNYIFNGNSKKKQAKSQIVSSVVQKSHKSIGTTIITSNIYPGSKSIKSIVESIKMTEVNIGRAVSLLKLMPNQYRIVDSLLCDFEVKIIKLQEKKAVLKALAKFGIGTSKLPNRKEYILECNYLDLALPVNVDQISSISLNGNLIYSDTAYNFKNKDTEEINENDPIVSTSILEKEESSKLLVSNEHSNKRYFGPLYRMYASVESDGRARFMFTSSHIKNILYL